MELKKIQPSADIEIDVASGVLQFTVKHISRAQATLDFQGMKPSEKTVVVLTEAITAWNLSHDDGTPWPCDPETKALVLPQLFSMPTKKKVDAEGKELIPEGVMLGLVLYSFVTDEENFLKN